MHRLTLQAKPQVASPDRSATYHSLSMKRDMDLVRQILLAIEEAPGFAPTLNIDGYTDEQIGFHVIIMIEANLIHGADVTGDGDTGPMGIPTRLSWEGHDFLDAARDPSRWQQAKDAIGPIGGASIQVWIGVLTQVMKQSLGLE